MQRRARVLLVRAASRVRSQISLLLDNIALIFTPTYSTCAAETRNRSTAPAVSVALPHGADVAVLLLIAGMFTAFCTLMSPSRSEAVDRFAASMRNYVQATFAPAAPEVRAAVPNVLVVSRRRGDYTTAVATLSPRGVGVTLAQDIPAAIEHISQAHEPFGLLVVDGELAGDRRLLREAKQRFPNVTVLRLEGERRPAAVATALMNYASQTL